MRDEGSKFLWGLFGLALTLAGIVYLVIPSWKAMLGFDTWWAVLLFLIPGAIVGSLINIPVGARINGDVLGLNAWGFAMPIAILVWRWGELSPTFTYLPAVLVPAIAILVGIRSRFTGSVEVRRIDLHGAAILTAALGHAILDAGLAERMYWAFGALYLGVLLIDIYYLIARCEWAFGFGLPRIAVGGAGGDDGLWIAPTYGVFYAYLLDLVF